jgi:lipopolysaccharide export system permease protein
LLKKLDILIIRSFILPFLATFLIAEFILTMQFFWLYLDDLVGKGLNLPTLFRLIGLVVISWVPLALPLAMLLSSIMTFGNLGETFEIVAIKASGISLIRFMKPLIVVACFIMLGAFLCLNYFIPVSILKLESLKHDIIVKQPAFDIKEGVFYNKLRGFVIKIGKKEANDSTIKDIVIFENSGGKESMIVAKSGAMKPTAGNQFLEFILYDGCRYEEKGKGTTMQNDYYRMGFSKYSKLLDLSSLAMGNTTEQGFEKTPKMLSARQINLTLDSIKKQQKSVAKAAFTSVNRSFVFLKYADTGWLKKDTFKYAKVKKFESLIPDSIKKMVYQNVSSSVSSAASNAYSGLSIYQLNDEAQKNYAIEYNKRFSYSFACLMLFLIGAPLGSIIRKGGLGTPLVFAIVFFAIFHLVNTFGEKLAKQGVVSPFVGIWLSAFVLMPIAVFLISKALNDSQLFNNEFYFRLFRQLKSILKKAKNNE